MPWLVTTGPSIVTVPLFALWFVITSAALGRRILVWLRASSDASALEKAVIALGLGAGALQLVPFALGVAHLLSVNGLRIALAALSVALVFDIKSVLVSSRKLLPVLRSLERRSWLWMLAILPALVVAGLLALTPAIDTDGLSYHLAVPKRWLQAESLVYLPTYPYSNTPMGIEMLFGIALACVGDIGTKVLHFVLGLGAAVGLCLAGARLGNRAAGVFAAVVYLVIPPLGVALVLGWAYLEGIIALAVIASTLAWLVWYRERDAGWLRAAALLAGISVSFKITVVLFALALAAVSLYVFWVEARARGDAPLRALGPVWALVPLVLAPVLPWFVRAALVTGNPFFPLFTSVFTARDYSPEIAGIFSNYNRYFVWGSGRLASWGVERRQLILLAATAGAAGACAFFCVKVRTGLARAVALAGFCVVAGQLYAVGLYARYWMPLAPLFVLLAATPFARPISAGWARAVLVLVTAFLSLQRARGNLNELRDSASELALTALDLRSPHAFLNANLPLFPLFERANRDVPDGSVVMLSYWCGGSFHIDRRTVCTEFLQDALRLKSWDAFSGDIERLGVTHVLAPRILAEGGRPPIDPAAPVLFRKNQDEFLARLITTRGRLLASASDQGLYAIARP
jgi:hypothetical protein